MSMIFAIGLGGASGALLRHIFGQMMLRLMGPMSFPAATMTINILGSFLIGLLFVTMAHRFDISPSMRGFLVVGLLGGFTTFSTFSMEAVMLLQRGQLGQASLYILGSVGFGILAMLAGVWLGRLMMQG